VSTTPRYRLFAAVAFALAVCLLPGVPVGAQGQADDERPITLDLRDASIEDVLRVIFRDTPYSFTLEQGVTGRVTLSLTNVPFPRALRAVLDINNPKLTYRKEDGVYVITTEVAPAAPAAPVAEVSQPASEQMVYWIGPGGRYELQYLDCRDVAVWFGGIIVGGTPQQPVSMGGATGGIGTGTSGLGRTGTTGLTSGTSSLGGLTSGTSSLGGLTSGTGSLGNLITGTGSGR
jgi:hypothetical protein